MPAAAAQDLANSKLRAEKERVVGVIRSPAPEINAKLLTFSSQRWRTGRARATSIDLHKAPSAL
jgi:hypothetical protein